MSTATLPSAADIQRAADDADVYAELIHQFKTDDAREAFTAAMLAVYRADRTRGLPLTPADKHILQFAARIQRREFRTTGHCEQAIRDEFGYSATRYFQALNTLIDRPEAARAYPVLLNRLRAQRDARQAARSVAA